MLILLDSLGPHTKKAADVVMGFQKHVQQRLKGKPPCSIYPNLENAVATRCATVKAFPGNQYISEEAATEYLARRKATIPPRSTSQVGLHVVNDRRTSAPTLPGCGIFKHENMLAARQGWYALSPSSNCKGKRVVETNSLRNTTRQSPFSC